MEFSKLDRVGVALAVAGATASYYLLKIGNPKPVPFVQQIPRRTSGLKALILGHLSDFIGEESYAWHLHWKAKLGGPTPLAHRFFVFQRLAIYDPADMHYVLLNTDGNTKKPSTYERLAFAIGRGLVSITPDDEHDAHRRHVSPAFSPKALKTVADETVRSEAVELIKALQAVAVMPNPEDRSIKFQSTMNGITLRIIADAAFHTTAEEKKELANSLGKSMQSIGVAVTIPGGTYFPSESVRIIRERNAILYAASKKIVNRIKAGDQPKDGEGKALIDYLVFNKNLSVNAIMEHCITFVFAGYETTSTAMTWMALCLSENPKCQEKLYEELASYVGRGTFSSLDELKHCKYALCVIKETMRLHPPAPHVTREAKEDLVLPGSKTFVPRGTLLPSCILLTHRSKEVWGPDAEEFRPERWEDDPTLEERMTASGAYLPFSMGRRNCIGKDFAMNELLLLTCAVYRNFRLSLTEGQKPVIRKAAITLGMRHPLLVVVEARTN